MRHILIRLLLAIMVTVAIFLSEYVQDNYARAIMAAFGGAAILFLDPLLEWTANRRKGLERAGYISAQTRRFVKFYQKYSGISVEVIPLSKSLSGLSISLTPDGVAREIIYNQLPLDGKKMDAIFLVYMCQLIEEESDDIRAATMKARVSQLLSTYDFMRMNEDARMIIQHYHNYSCGRRFDDTRSNLDYNKIFDEFSKKYSISVHLAFKMFLEKEQAEEFRKTLSILIARGRLSLKQLGKDVSKKIEKEISETAKKSRAYLLLSNKWYAIPEVEARLNSMPGIKIGTKYPTSLPDSIMYLHMRIIYPPENYATPREFIEGDILPLIPDDQKNKGFIAIIPIEGTEVFAYPKEAGLISDERIRESYKAVPSIKTGVTHNFADIFLDAIRTEIQIQDILSIIPFNIFVPGLKTDIRDLIIDNYDGLKAKWNINVLSDWASVPEEELGDEFISIDKTRQSNRRLYKDENWRSLAGKIIAEAKKHVAAMSA